MSVYFLDKDQRTIKIVTDANTISSEQTLELNHPDLLVDYLTVTISNKGSWIDEAQYMAVSSYQGNDQSYDLYRITNQQLESQTLTFVGVNNAYYELAGYVIEDFRPTKRDVSFIATQLLANTGYRVGYVEQGIRNVTTNFYYLSVKDSFAKLQEVSGCEVVFKVEISGTKITDKWVEVYKKLGDKTLKRFNYGTNALDIVRETGTQSLYTGLIGLGKGEEVGDGFGRKINFSNVVWKKPDKPVNKPKGQKYIELPEATEQYGIKTNSGMKPRIGIVEFNDEEDVEQLAVSTYEALVETSRPRVEFKSTVLYLGATNIGDTVTIHRHDLDIHYKARVFKIVRNRLNDKLSQLSLGDAVSQSSSKKQASINKVVGSLKDDIYQDVNYVLSTADGKNAINYGNDEPTEKRTGDLWFRDHPSLAGERQMLIWDGNAWIIELDTSELDKVRKEVEQILKDNVILEQEFRDRMAMTDKEIKEFEDKLANLNFEIDNKVIDNISPEVVMGAIKDAGFGQAVDDIKNKVNSTSDSLDTTIKLVGNNGKQTYNKNRTTLTELLIPFGVDKKTIAHNGEGFEVNQPYTVSFAARLIERGNSRVIFDFEVLP